MKGPWILLIVGLVLFVASFGVAIVSLLLPALTNGRTDMEEAMLGVIPGGCCSSLALAMVLGAVIWLVASASKR
jgi:uncharacterized membrane protein AbrB (regulator of aidB expression)